MTSGGGFPGALFAPGVCRLCEHSAGGVCPMCDPDPLDASLDYMIQVWKDEGDDYALDVMGDLIPARLLLTAIKRIPRDSGRA